MIGNRTDTCAQPPGPECSWTSVTDSPLGMFTDAGRTSSRPAASTQSSSRATSTRSTSRAPLSRSYRSATPTSRCVPPLMGQEAGVGQKTQTRSSNRATSDTRTSRPSSRPSKRAAARRPTTFTAISTPRCAATGRSRRSSSSRSSASTSLRPVRAWSRRGARTELRSTGTCV